MNKLTICLMLLLSGCATLDQQKSQQAAWDAMTPQQQMVELERRRVEIDQQRANNEQIATGLATMKSTQPMFVYPDPVTGVQRLAPIPQKPPTCTNLPAQDGSPVTVCN